jgi:type II secretory pathway pseudopilin PulG
LWRPIRHYVPEDLAERLAAAAAENRGELPSSRLAATLTELIEHIYGRAASLEIGDVEMTECGCLIAIRKDQLSHEEPKWFDGHRVSADYFNWQHPFEKGAWCGTLARPFRDAIYRLPQFHDARQRAAERIETLEELRQPVETQLYRLRQEQQAQAAEQQRVAEELREQVAKLLAAQIAVASQPSSIDVNPPTPPSPITPGKWLRRELDQLDIESAYRIAQLGGPKQNTTARALADKAVRRTTWIKLLKVLDAERKSRKLEPIDQSTLPENIRKLLG